MRRGFLGAAWLLVVACSGEDSDTIDSNDGADGQTRNDGGSEPPTDAGTDAAVPGDLDDVSGTRLRARRWTTDDGLAALEGITDLAFDAPCQVLPALDGSVRCVPGSFTVAVRFLDDACTQPVLYQADVACPNADSAFYYTRSLDSCPQAYRAYRRGAAQALPATLYDLSSGTCTAITPAGGSVVGLEELAPAEMVAVSDGVRGPDGAVRAQFQEGEDGSRFFAGYVDGAQGSACTAQRLDGEMRCVAAVGANVSRGSFADATCETPLLSVYGACANPGPYAIEYATDASGCSAPTVYAIGAPVETPYVMDTACVASTAPAPAGAYARGDVVQATMFAPLASQDEGGTRIVAPSFVFAGLRGVARDSAFYDRTLELACYPRQVGDGSTRCLPEAGGAVRYADDACTTPRVGVYTRPCSDAFTWVTVSGQDANGCSLQEPYVVTLGPATDAPPQVFAKHGTDCVAVTESYDAWYELGEQLGPGQFAAMQRTVE